jgi:hypothetical protein
MVNFFNLFSEAKRLGQEYYSKNNENVTFITIFFVKIVTYEKLTKFKTKIKW